MLLRCENDHALCYTVTIDIASSSSIALKRQRNQKATILDFDFNTRNDNSPKVVISVCACTQILSYNLCLYRIKVFIKYYSNFSCETSVAAWLYDLSLVSQHIFPQLIILLNY